WARMGVSPRGAPGLLPLRRSSRHRASALTRPLTATRDDVVFSLTFAVRKAHLRRARLAGKVTNQMAGEARKHRARGSSVMSAKYTFKEADPAHLPMAYSAAWTSPHGRLARDVDAGEKHDG